MLLDAFLDGLRPGEMAGYLTLEEVGVLGSIEGATLSLPCCSAERALVSLCLSRLRVAEVVAVRLEQDEVNVDTRDDAIPVVL